MLYTDWLLLYNYCIVITRYKYKSNLTLDKDMQTTHPIADQQPSCAIINVRNLRLRTLIGFNPEERVKKQDVVLNIEIKYALDNGV